MWLEAPHLSRLHGCSLAKGKNLKYRGEIWELKHAAQLSMPRVVWNDPFDNEANLFSHPYRRMCHLKPLFMLSSIVWW